MPNANDAFMQQTPVQTPFYASNMGINRVPQAGNPNAFQQGQQYQVTPQIPPKILDTVQGDLAASIYPINYYPQEIFLVDMDQGFTYTRCRDNTGKLSPLKKFKMVPVEEEEREHIDTSKFVKEDEILDLISEVVQDQLEKKLSEMLGKKGGKES